MIKKAGLIFIFLIFCLFMFAGCDSQMGDASQGSALTHGAIATENGVFSITKQGFVDYMDSMLVKEGFMKLSECKNSSGTTDEKVPYKYTQYELGDGASLFLYTHTDNDKLTDMYLSADTTKLTESTQKMFYECELLSIGEFDSANQDMIIDTLNLENITDYTSAKTNLVKTTANGKNANYIYKVTNDEISLTIKAQYFIGSENGKFTVTPDKLIAYLDKALTEAGYGKISACKVVKDSGTNKEVGDYNIRLYTIGEGVYFEAFDSKADGKVLRLGFLADKNNLTDKGKKIFEDYLDMTIRLVDPNSARNLLAVLI